MSDKYLTSNSYINSIIGEGSFIKGDIKSEGLLRIDGDFSGYIESTGKVLIGKNGRAESIINADTVVVGGVVKGNIYATERVIVLTSGIVLGNIRSPRLVVESDVIIHGKCTVLKDGSVDLEAEIVEEKKDINSYNPALKEVN